MRPQVVWVSEYILLTPGKEFFSPSEVCIKFQKAKERKKMEIGIPLNDAVTIVLQALVFAAIVAGTVYAVISILIKTLINDLVWPAVIKLGVLFSQHKQ